MLNQKLFINAIQMLEEEKKIPAQVIKEALEEALESAYKREYDAEANVETIIDLEEATVKLFNIKTIVDEIDDDLTEIHIDEARKINPNFKVGDVIKEEIDLDRDFSRIATNQVSQVVRQKFREVEKQNIFKKWKTKIDELVVGLVERVEPTYAIVAIEETFGFLPSSSIPSKVALEPGDRVKVLVTDIKEDAKGAPVVVSMKEANIVKRMLEESIPEIYDGKVEIKAIARFAGERTKIAVATAIDGLDPVGAVIGDSGERIKPIIKELNGEFIDIIQYDDNIEQMIVNALTPAKVIGVKVYPVDETGARRATAVVKDDVFTLAIGKIGSNAKVASRLCATSIDIKSESQAHEAKIDYPINGNAITADMNKFIDDEIGGLDITDFTPVLEHTYDTPNTVSDEDAEVEEFYSVDSQEAELFTNAIDDDFDEFDDFDDSQRTFDEDIDYDEFEEYYED